MLPTPDDLLVLCVLVHGFQDDMFHYIVRSENIIDSHILQFINYSNAKLMQLQNQRQYNYQLKQTLTKTSKFKENLVLLANT